MRLLTHTNIIVDDFELCKDYKKNTFIHFLTHFHQDHWQGMTPLWDYGVIFCTEITRRFILNMFPKIDNIIVLEYNTTYKLDLKEQCLTEQPGQFTIEISAFDANHIPGSAMFLFKGFMGTILHTGDFRYTESMYTNNPILFPNGNPIVIDEMIFDNTYCDPMFNFPVASVVAKQMIDIICKNKGKRILIAMGALGKEVICLKLSQYFNTPLLVSPQKFKQMQAAQIIDLKLFTMDGSKSWIEIIKKRHRQERIEQEFQEGKSEFICITTDFLMLTHRDPDGINYIVPYSLHSNYEEMKRFINLIRPAILRKLVIPFENFAEYRRRVRINPLKAFKGYLKRLEQNGESGYSQLIRHSTNFTKLSQNYLQWMHEGKSQQVLMELGVQLEPDRINRKRNVDKVMPKPSLKQQIYELEQQYVFGPKKEKILSLDDIAIRLAATNNNIQITKFIKPVKQEEQRDVDQQYDDGELIELMQQFMKDK